MTTRRSEPTDRPAKRKKQSIILPFKQNEKVLYKEHGNWYFGIVKRQVCRDDNLSIRIDNNFVLFPALSQSVLFNIPTSTNTLGGIKRIQIDWNGLEPQVCKVPEELDVAWRSNIKKHQLLWYRNLQVEEYHDKCVLKCIVVGLLDDRVMIQPLCSRICVTVNCNSATLEPIISSNPFSFAFGIPFDVHHDWFSLEVELNDRYIGANCTIGTQGYFIGEVDRKYQKYCCFNNNGYNHNIRQQTFDVKWVDKQDIQLDENTVSNFRNDHAYHPEDDAYTKTIMMEISHRMFGYGSREFVKVYEYWCATKDPLVLYAMSHSTHFYSNTIEELKCIAYNLIGPCAYKSQARGYLQTKAHIFTLHQAVLRKKAQYLEGEDLERLFREMEHMRSGRRSHDMRNALQFERQQHRMSSFGIDMLDWTCTDNRYFLSVKVSFNKMLTTQACGCRGSDAAVVNSYTCNYLEPFMHCQGLEPTPTSNENLNRLTMDHIRGRRTTKMVSDFEAYNDNHKRIGSLLKYQTWLVDEMSKEEANVNPLSHIYVKKGASMDYNSITGFCHANTAVSNGGILALHTGWGKTIVMIELLRRQGGCTLIVLPLSIIDQWKSELKRFAPELRVTEFYGTKKTDTGQVVLTTYNTLSRSVTVKAYDRVVFDESHTVKSSSSRVAQACISVDAKYRWCVTATPFEGNPKNYQTQLQMLKIQPFDVYDVFKMIQMFRKMLHRAVFALDATTLRSMGIHPIKKRVAVDEIVKVEHGKHTQALIQHFHDIVQRHYFGNLYDNKSWLRRMVVQMQVICTNPALYPMHNFATMINNGAQRISVQSFIGRLDNNHNTAFEQEVMKSLENVSDGVCCVCLSEFTEPTITPCLHIFCNQCLQECLKRKTACPQCRTTVDKHKICVLAPPIPEENTVIGDKYTFTNSLGSTYEIPVTLRDAYNALSTPPKFQWILEKTRTATNCIVFSQYEMVLNSLERYLRAQNVSTGRISGKISRSKRKKNIEDFMNGQLKVFLLTTKAAACGINLQEGSMIVFMEPLLERQDAIQAIGRLKRIGQQNDIRMYTLCTKNTYEEDVKKALEEYYNDSKEESANYARRLKYEMYKKSILKLF